MQAASIITIVYGFMIASGGCMGYMKAHSIKSLIVGGIAGIVLIVAGAAMRDGKSWALPTAYGITTALLLFFIAGFIHTHKMMPAGSTIILCIVELVLLAVTTRRKVA